MERMVLFLIWKETIEKKKLCMGPTIFIPIPFFSHANKTTCSNFPCFFPSLLPFLFSFLPLHFAKHSVYELSTASFILQEKIYMVASHQAQPKAKTHSMSSIVKKIKEKKIIWIDRFIWISLISNTLIYWKDTNTINILNWSRLGPISSPIH